MIPMAIGLAKFQNVLSMGNRICNFGFFLTMSKCSAIGIGPNSNKKTAVPYGQLFFILCFFLPEKNPDFQSLKQLQGLTSRYNIVQDGNHGNHQQDMDQITGSHTSDHAKKPQYPNYNTNYGN